METKRIIRMNTLFAERFWPLVAGILGTVLGIVLYNFNYVLYISSSILSSGITVGAIFAGFDVTHKTLLITLNSNKIKQLENVKSYYNYLIGYMNANLKGALIFVIYSFILLHMIDSNQIFNLAEHWWKPFAFALWLGCGTYMCTAFWRISSIFTVLLCDQP